MESTNIIISKINKLKEKISDFAPGHSVFGNDWYLVHFIRVSNGNVDKAESLVRKSLEWKQKVSVDIETALEIMNALGVKFVPTIDGISSLYFSQILHGDLKNVVKQYGANRILEALILVMDLEERRFIEGVNRKCSTLEEKIQYRSPTFITSSLEGFSIRQFSFQVAELSIGFASIIAETYPALYSSYIFVNAGGWTNMLLKLISPILARGGDISVHAPNDLSWKSRIRQMVDSKSLVEISPVFL